MPADDSRKQAEIDYPQAAGEQGRAWIRSKPFGHHPRETARFLIDFLRHKYPPFHNAHLSDAAAQIGIRETRRITGEYVLTAEDILSVREFDDAIARCAYPIDVHSSTGHGVKMGRMGKRH